MQLFRSNNLRYLFIHGLYRAGNLSFPIIATINGQTLHNHHHGNTIKSGDLFLLDAGAETELYYAGDLSSTFPVDPASISFLN